MSQAKNNVNVIMNSIAAAQTNALNQRKKAQTDRAIVEATIPKGQTDKNTWMSRFFGKLRGDAGGTNISTRSSASGATSGQSSSSSSYPSGKPSSSAARGAAIMVREDRQNMFRDNQQVARQMRNSYRQGSLGYEDNMFATNFNKVFKNKPVLIFLYLLKFARIAIIFGALYLASKTFQSRYVNNVFVNNENPPNLTAFVLIYVAIEMIFMILVLFILYLLSKVISNDDGRGVLMPETIAMFAFDYFVSSAIIALIGIMLAMVIMKKKYFRYRTDGLRAIRSLQEMMLNVAIVALLFPYFALRG